MDKPCARARLIRYFRSLLAFSQQKRKQTPQFRTFLRCQRSGQQTFDFLDARPQSRQLLRTFVGEKEYVAAFVDRIVRPLDQSIAHETRDEIGDGRTVHVEFVAERALIDARHLLESGERRILHARHFRRNLAEPYRNMTLLGTAHEAACVPGVSIGFIQFGRQFAVFRASQFIRKMGCRYASSSEYAFNGRTCATYWSGRTTISAPRSRSMPRSVKISVSALFVNAFS